MINFNEAHTLRTTVKRMYVFLHPFSSFEKSHKCTNPQGLAFSVRKGVRIPPSLRNIYKQMHADVPEFVIPKHGQVGFLPHFSLSPHKHQPLLTLTLTPNSDLTEWAKHGVLLLNTALTVRAHEAASHSGKGWEQFTAAVLRVVTSRLAPSTSAESGSMSESAGNGHVGGANGVCFMAWGAHAQKMCAGVDTVCFDCRSIVCTVSRQS